MDDLLLLSIVFAAVGLPIVGARTSDPRVGLRRTLLRLLGFHIIYLLAVLYVWRRLAG